METALELFGRFFLCGGRRRGTLGPELVVAELKLGAGDEVLAVLGVVGVAREVQGVAAGNKAAVAVGGMDFLAGLQVFKGVFCVVFAEVEVGVAGGVIKYFEVGESVFALHAGPGVEEFGRYGEVVILEEDGGGLDGAAAVPFPHMLNVSAVLPPDAEGEAFAAFDRGVATGGVGQDERVAVAVVVLPFFMAEVVGDAFFFKQPAHKLEV